MNKIITQFLQTIKHVGIIETADLIEKMKTDATGNRQPFGNADFQNIFEFVARHRFVAFEASPNGIKNLELTLRGLLVLKNPASFTPCANLNCEELVETPHVHCSIRCRRIVSLFGGSL